ncbi:MAG: YciI family protein [Pseudomonadota bacterium]
MPLWNEYKSIARERGALALELYVVVSTCEAQPAEMQETLPRHLAYQKELEARGALFLAGPTSDETGEQMQGNGLMIYRATSMDDARALAEADPMHAEGRRSYTLRKWLVNEGGLELSVKLSGQASALS